MNSIRVWVLRLAAIAALLGGGYLLYDANQDLTWGHRAIAEAGLAAYRPGSIQNSILSESAEKRQAGTLSEYAGFLFIAAALMMDGISGVLMKDTSAQKAE